DLQNDSDFAEDDAITETHFLTEEDLSDLENYENMKLLLSAINGIAEIEDKKMFFTNHLELVNEMIENYKIMGWAKGAIRR
ncbi:hypothetical protein L9F63_019111, partial [Diploptera punctata]